jgi:hypothetical protein
MSELLTPPVIAALVNAGGSVLNKIITWVQSSADSGKADADVAIEKTYPILREAFTDGCVRILKAFENGQAAHALMVRQRLYTDLVFPDPMIASAFEGELRYRLEYMRLHGVLAPVGRTEFGITSLGQAFLEEARRRRDYYNVLF